jgi:hypothetical protein
MICVGFTKEFFLYFEIKIIKYSPINQQKGHNFAYLQEGIVVVSLILIDQSRLDRLNLYSMAMKPIKKGY